MAAGRAALAKAHEVGVEQTHLDAASAVLEKAESAQTNWRQEAGQELVTSQPSDQDLNVYDLSSRHARAAPAPNVGKAGARQGALTEYGSQPSSGGPSAAPRRSRSPGTSGAARRGGGQSGLRRWRLALSWPVELRSGGE